MGSSDYAQEWNDCLRLVIEILENAKDLEDAVNKIDYLKALVGERCFKLKYDQIKTELGVFRNLF